MTIGERIKATRKSKGMTQKQLADFCGTFDSAIRKYESGLVTPKQDKLELIAHALSVDISELRPPTFEFPENSRDDTEPVSPTELARANAIKKLWNIIDFVNEDTEDPNHKDAIEQIWQALKALSSTLNEDGQKKLIDYAQDLAEHDKYKKPPETSDG